MSMRIQIFGAALGLSLAVCACDDSAERIEKLNAQASQLTTEWAPKLDSAGAKVVALKERVSRLATEQQGEVGKLLSNAEAQIVDAKSSLMDLPNKVQHATGSGKLTELPMEFATVTSNISTTVNALETELGSAEQKVHRLEKAAEQEPSAEGFETKLSSGYTVTGNLSGIEQQLIGFIDDAGKPVDKTTWFNFDRLAFKTGSADLDMESSKAQLENMAELLKAFPRVKLKVGGYTDNTGPAAVNKKLSTQRAQAVVEALESLGVAKRRLAAEGYGPLHPACPANDTDECRAKNRRIAVRVAAK